METVGQGDEFRAEIQDEKDMPTDQQHLMSQVSKKLKVDRVQCSEGNLVSGVSRRRMPGVQLVKAR